MLKFPLQNNSLVSQSNFTLRRIFNQSSQNLQNYNQKQVLKNSNKPFDSSYTTRYNKLVALLKDKN